MFTGNKKGDEVPFKKNADLNNTINILGGTTYIKGELDTENDIRLDGKVEGIVRSKAKVVIGESAVIQGDIYCLNADISGRVLGNVYCDDLLHLKSKSKIKGDLFTKKLVVELGSQLNGNCEMGDKMSERKLKPNTETKEFDKPKQSKEKIEA